VSTTTDKNRPALVGGLVIGVLSALPIISAGNVCCCLWVIGGGLVASYLLQQNQSAPLTAGDGAMVGLLAGVYGAIITTLLSIPITLIIGPLERQVIERLAESTGVSVGEYWSDTTSPAMFVVLGFVMLLVGSVFSTIGGLIGSAIFRKPPQPGFIDVPPSQQM
jgi:hypothetical protein